MLPGLIRLLEPFGVNARLTRTSVFRLARERWLGAKRIGRRSLYRLTPSGARRFEQAYRRIYAPPADSWNEEWELVIAGALPARRRQALRDELHWAGFGVLAPGVHARPVQADDAPLPAAATALPGLIVVRARDAGPANRESLAASVPRAWDLTAHRFGLSQIPAPLRRRHRALPAREPRRPRSRAVLRGAHAADPRIPPRPAARSAAAGRAPAARLARAPPPTRCVAISTG